MIVEQSGYGTQIIEASGVSYRLTDASARLRLGVDPRSCDALRWLVVNDGVAAVRRDRLGATVMIAPQALVARAAEGLACYLERLSVTDGPRPPIAVMVYVGAGSWQSHHVEGIAEALAVIETARRRRNSRPEGSYVVAEPTSEDSIRAADPYLGRLLQRYRIDGGRYQPRFIEWLGKTRLIDHVILTMYDERAKGHVVSHIGMFFDYNGDEWPLQAVGQRIDEGVDPIFGKFTVDSLRVVEAERTPVFTGVDLAIDTPRGITRASFQRMLLPFAVPNSARLLIVGASTYTVRQAA
ncbi:MAG: hypothetical protein HYR63_08655 [Proteobacteria bacterium]|nr:hypothetical protein [Pseudomonadota bacterium]